MKYHELYFMRIWFGNYCQVKGNILFRPILFRFNTYHLSTLFHVVI